MPTNNTNVLRQAFLGLAIFLGMAFTMSVVFSYLDQKNEEQKSIESSNFTADSTYCLTMLQDVNPGNWVHDDGLYLAYANIRNSRLALIGKDKVVSLKVKVQDPFDADEGIQLLILLKEEVSLFTSQESVAIGNTGYEIKLTGFPLYGPALVSEKSGVYIVLTFGYLSSVDHQTINVSGTEHPDGHHYRATR